MIKLIKLAEQKGWSYNDELVRIGIKMPTMSVVEGSLVEANISEDERTEVGYYTMRQIERWLMKNHNIYIAVKLYSETLFGYTIEIENAKPYTIYRNDSYDAALYEALTEALNTLPNQP